MKNALIFIGFLLAIQAVTAQPSTTTDKEVQKLEQELARRQQIFHDQYINEPSVRGGLNAAAEASLLSEVVIFAKAKELGLSATEAEAHTFLLPMLAQQGLVDYTSKDVFKDPNVYTWIKGQPGMTLNDLKNSGKTLVLWTKIVTQNVPVTEEEVKKYAEDNPAMVIAPARIRIALTQYTPPPALASRSVLPHEVLTPTMALTTRAAAADMEQPAPKAYEHLQLWLELEKIDIELRKAISGQKVGYSFGPLLLANGAVVEGKIQEFMPEANFSSNPDFWLMATIRARLAKANQGSLFEAMVEELSATHPSPAVRGWLGKIWKGVKKGFSHITSGVGGLIGFAATGNPKAAFIGAKMGWQFGNAVKGWFSNNRIPSQMGVVFPQQSIPSTYLNNNRYQIPSTYFSPEYGQSRFDYIVPQISPVYRPQLVAYPQQQQQYNNWGLPVEEQWAPQMFFPQPVRYY